MIGFNTVEGEFSYQVIIERSKFICYLKGIENEDQAKEYINSIKKINSLANHNCYAYIADEQGLIMKFSDDGEPQGTAGLPMLEVLKNKRLYKTVAVVTRYFGGIKLGTGGLTRAYSGAVASCVDVSKVLRMRKGVLLEIFCDYESYSFLLKILNNPSINVIDTEFGDKILVKLSVATEYYDKLIQSLSDLFKGKPDFKNIKTDYFSFGEDLCQK